MQPFARLSVLLVLFCAACTSPAALPPCDPGSTHRPICDLTNPEDVGFLPDRSWLIVSEMAPNQAGDDDGEAAPAAGRLTAIRLVDLERRPLYPTGREVAVPPVATPGWGDARCPGPPDPEVFQPHGIDVGTRPDGRHALAVVNHGGREAVELFEIGPEHVPSVEWRGCVPMPEGVMSNDVAFLPDGGFVVTNFMPAFDEPGPSAIWSMLKISMGAATGSVLRWEPGGEIVEIENSEGSAPNGVEASADGTEIFVAEWGGQKLYRLRLDEEGAPTRDEISLDQNPDNLTWTRDGRLLVAGQHGGVLTSLGCGSIRDAGCDLGYSVYLIEPVGLEATRIIEGRGAASVALEVGDEVYVGAFVGDQIMRVRLED
jgi:sugar lactone lactonase YvrE